LEQGAGNIEPRSMAAMRIFKKLRTRAS
jgi:hypothetical protein